VPGAAAVNQVIASSDGGNSTRYGSILRAARSSARGEIGKVRGKSKADQGVTSAPPAGGENGDHGYPPALGRVAEAKRVPI
jgi:hypothetical protein